MCRCVCSYSFLVNSMEKLLSSLDALNTTNITVCLYPSFFRFISHTLSILVQGHIVLCFHIFAFCCIVGFLHFFDALCELNEFHCIECGVIGLLAMSIWNNDIVKGTRHHLPERTEENIRMPILDCRA